MRIPHARRPVLVLAALVLALGGCASSGGGGSSGASSDAAITRVELSEVGQLDALQAVRRLRPSWLRRRGGDEPQVMLDGLLMNGGTGALRTMRVSDIRTIEFLDPSDATMRFGTGYPGGVILVTSGG